MGQLKIFHIEPEIADVTKQPGQRAWLIRDFDGDHGKFLRFLPVFSMQGHGAVLPESQKRLERLILVEHSDQVVEVRSHLAQFFPDGHRIGRDDLSPQSGIRTGDACHITDPLSRQDQVFPRHSAQV